MTSKAVIAVYEDGVLRLLAPLPLPEHTRVRVHVEPVSQESVARVDQEAQATDTDAGVDPWFDLIGAYRSPFSLIDGIPPSEDPDLYLVAEMLGEQAVSLHAWEIAPTRYVQGQDGRPARRSSLKASHRTCNPFSGQILAR